VGGLIGGAFGKEFGGGVHVSKKRPKRGKKEEKCGRSTAAKNNLPAETGHKDSRSMVSQLKNPGKK